MEYIDRFLAFASGGVPSYAQNFRDIKWGFEYCLANCSGDFTPLGFIKSLQSFAVLDNLQNDALVILGLAVLWTSLRYIFSAILFKPIARWFKLPKTNAEKYPESAWKLLVYSFTWSLTIYTIFGIPHLNHIFYKPDSLWNDYVRVGSGLPNHVQGMQVEPIVYYVYTLQISFYVHSIYASLFMDVWRRDSILMVFHHFLTIALLGFSYLTRYHKIGLLVLFVHDPTDIALEFTKCNVYFKNRGGNFYKIHDHIATLGFITFAVFWYVFRLYWMPLKILHSTGYGSMIRYSQTQHLPFYFFFNVMLWILQLLNVYWFFFIISFLVKVATGQMDEVDDIREDEVLEEKVKKPKANKLKETNGAGRRQSPRTKAKKID